MRELIQALCSPITQVIILLCLASISTHFYKNKHLGKTLVVIAALWLLLCSQYFFSSLLLQPIEHKYRPLELHADTLSTATQIFILAGYYQSNSTQPEHTRWSEATYQRISNGLFLHEYWKLPLIISGGNFLLDAEQNYAEAVAQFYTTRGVAESDLILVKSGTNTYEELIEVAALLENETTIIISSATHIPRIAMLLNEISPEAKIIYFPVEYLSNSSWQLTFNNPSAVSITRVERAIYEYIALLYIAIQQRLA